MLHCSLKVSIILKDKRIMPAKNAVHDAHQYDVYTKESDDNQQVHQHIPYQSGK